MISRPPRKRSSPPPPKRRSNTRSNKPEMDENIQQRPPKRTTTLLRAMAELNVASQETCAFLIRCSRVRVNGELVTDEKTTVSRLEDHIFVNDRDFGTVVHGIDHADEWQQRSPRSHRDRPQSEIDSLSRQFNRKVDDGFYKSKKFKAGH